MVGGPISLGAGDHGSEYRPHRQGRVCSTAADDGSLKYRDRPLEVPSPSTSSHDRIRSLLPHPRYAERSLTFEDLSWLEVEDRNFLITSVLNHPPRDRKVKEKYVNRDTVPYFVQRRRLLRRYVLGNSRSLVDDAEFGELFRTVKDLKSEGSHQCQSSEGLPIGRSTQDSGRKQIWLVERTQCDRPNMPMAPGTLMVCKCIDIEALFHDPVGGEEEGEEGGQGYSLDRHQGRPKHCIREDTLVEMFFSKLFTRFFGCPNFDRLIDVLHDSARVYFLFEFFEGGDLLDYMTARALQVQNRRRASVAESAPVDDLSGPVDDSVSAASPMSCPDGDATVRLTVDRQGLRKFFEEGAREEVVAIPSTPSKESKTEVQEETPPTVVRLNVKEVCIILASLTNALDLLHSLHLAHLDVSPEQVLVHISPHNGRVVSAALTDLAQCSTVNQLRTSSLRKSGKALYRAPEMYHQLPAVLAASRPPSLWLAGDMWSVGVVGLVMCLGGPLWASATADDEKYRHFLEHAGPDVFYYLSQVQHLPSELAALLAGLLQPQPQERLTISLCRMSEALSPEFMERHDVTADSEPHQLLQCSFDTGGGSQPHVGKRRMLFNAVIRSMVEVSMAIPLSPKMAHRTDTNNTATTVDSTRIESPSQLLPLDTNSAAASPLNEQAGVEK
ncbi:hypothetical protein FOZ61_006750 [Perkinsus olseni]|uniref:Protein kinase domain-containing protein n=1 Tax=Perkinsus olseni TaxID=32597 RepID=A0A7J6LBU1_PEROL|nr:hypothetical protein FOZ61_006750 [Perkinsus olseni]